MNVRIDSLRVNMDNLFPVNLILFSLFNFFMIIVEKISHLARHYDQCMRGICAKTETS